MAGVRSWLTQIKQDEEGPYYHVQVNGPDLPPPEPWSSSPYGYGDDPPPPDDYDPEAETEDDDEEDPLARALSTWRQQIA